MLRKSYSAWRNVADKEENHWGRPRSCMVSLVWWILDRAAWQGLNSTQSSGRMTGSGPGRPSRPGNPFVALLLLEKAQQAATGHWGGWSPVSLPELQSSCPAPRFGAAAPTPDRTSCSESGKQQVHTSDFKACCGQFEETSGFWSGRPLRYDIILFNDYKFRKFSSYLPAIGTKNYKILLLISQKMNVS